jgi:hypothetical protein
MECCKREVSNPQDTENESNVLSSSYKYCALLDDILNECVYHVGISFHSSSCFSLKTSGMILTKFLSRGPYKNYRPISVFIKD